MECLSYWPMSHSSGFKQLSWIYRVLVWGKVHVSAWPIPQVTKSLCVWWMAGTAVKGEWRSGLTEHGALSVTPIFPCMMLKSSVVCWAMIVQKGSINPMALVPGNILQCLPSSARVLRSLFWTASPSIPPAGLLPVQEWSVFMVSACMVGRTQLSHCISS